MTPEVNDFKALVHALADRYHEGAIYPMAERTGLSSALMDKWAKGTVRTPSLLSIRKLCRAYHLDFLKVVSIVERSRGALIALALLLCGTTAPGVEARSAVEDDIEPARNVTALCFIGSGRGRRWWWNFSAAERLGSMRRHLRFYRWRRSILVDRGAAYRSTRPVPYCRPALAGACA